MYDEHVEAIDALGWLIRLSSTPRLLPVGVMETDVFLSARILREELLVRPSRFCGGRIGVWCYTPSQYTQTDTHTCSKIGLIGSVLVNLQLGSSVCV